MYIYFSQSQYVVINKNFSRLLFFRSAFSSSLELNTLTITPSLLACACIQAAIKGLSLKNIHRIDELLFKLIHCKKVELIHTQFMIEKLFQACLQNIIPSPSRRCLAPIDTSAQQRTKVK